MTFSEEQPPVVLRDGAILLRERHTPGRAWSHVENVLTGRTVCSHDQQPWECPAARWAHQHISGTAPAIPLTAEQIRWVEAEVAAMLSERHTANAEASGQGDGVPVCVYDQAPWPCPHAEWAHDHLGDVPHVPVPVSPACDTHDGAVR